jgi:regulator of protease activity HflC (stomatin/prohibitin superfamily)
MRASGPRRAAVVPEGEYLDMNDWLWILITGAAGIALVAILAARRVTTIYPPNVGLLYRNGTFERDLEPGRYAYFDFGKRTVMVQVSTGRLPVTLGDFTVLSKDQFSFRVGLAPIVEVTDARIFAESQASIEPMSLGRFAIQVGGHAALHSQTASAAHEAVASFGLRELIADPKLLPAAVQAQIADAIPGAKVSSVLMTSITLPPETRKMFTDVERSKIEAEAALERARGEHAALRALANAARLIKDNPALANLRFLQTLEQAPGAKTIVLGSDAVLPLTGAGTKDK